MCFISEINFRDCHHIGRYFERRKGVNLAIRTLVGTSSSTNMESKDLAGNVSGKIQQCDQKRQGTVMSLENYFHAYWKSQWTGAQGSRKKK